MNNAQEIIGQVMSDFAPAMDTWSHHNCPACVSKGQSRPDTKGRGNHMFTSDGGVVYNCFNCHLKTGWKPGMYMSNEFESLLNSFGVNNSDLMKLRLIAKEMVESGDYQISTENSKVYQKITQRELPPNAKPFIEWCDVADQHPQFMKVLQYVNDRNPYLLDLELYWTPDKNNNFNERFIIPYYMNSKIVGYTARHIVKYSTMRYYNQVNTGLFYNFDLLNDEHTKNILVSEGPLDAALMGGVGANNYFLTAQQIEQLKNAQSRGKRIIIVPDRDKNGLETVQQALDNGFSVAFPDYGTIRDNYGIRYVKDFEEATALYGRLFSLQLIYENIYSTEFEIKLYANKWI